ncbi:MAG TPA: Na/Pi cotransporter family protein, partial [bacterium]|nr:Na/Pi cotransporter family protein [bacterium]
MPLDIDIKIILGILSAIIVFIYGIDSFSKEITANNSKTLRIVISRLAKNRYLATIIGAISTAIVHSSSAITAITVLFVSMGYISFKNSLGLIFGANIGTTVTAQLALVDSAIIAPTLIVAGFFLGILGKKFRMISKSVFFLGFILFSLNLLLNNITPLQSNAAIIELFSHMDNIFIALLVSAIFTILVQSSSITTGILIVLAKAGFLQTNIAIAMILGANIGSSTTALLISTKLDIFAKRTAWANLIFNFAGSAICVLLLNPFTSFVSGFSSDIPTQTAIAHLMFNLINTLIFLIILTPFSQFIEKIIKSDTEQDEILFETKFLKNLKSNKVKAVLDAVQKELIYTIDITTMIFDLSISLNKEFTIPKKNKIIKLESLNDYLDDEISKKLLEVSKQELSKKYANRIMSYIKISNTLEQIGALGKDYAELFVKLHDTSHEQSI